MATISITSDSAALWGERSLPADPPERPRADPWADAIPLADLLRAFAWDESMLSAMQGQGFTRTLRRDGPRGLVLAFNRADVRAWRDAEVARLESLKAVKI